MKQYRYLLALIAPLSLTACNEYGKQWLDPDKTFAALGQPDVKGVSDTQEDAAKQAADSGDFMRAAKFYEILLNSGKPTAQQQLRYKVGWANSVRRLGDNERALTMFEEIVAADPNNMDAAEGRALCLMALGKTVDASRGFSDIMEKDPKRWRTLNALGILFTTKNMIPEAMQYYAEAIKYSPDNAAVLNNVGLSQAIDKNYARANEALDQANRVSKLPAQRKQIDLNQALVYAVGNDLERAREIASKYFDGAALDNNMGLYAHLAKDDGLAKTYLNMALSQSATYYERAWNNLDALSNTDNSGKASAKLPSSKQLEPKPQPAPVVEEPKKPQEEVKKEPAAKTAKPAKATKASKGKAVAEPIPVVEEAKPEEKPVEVKAEPKAESKGENSPFFKKVMELTPIK